ncbi:MAG TPA: hypothetical protein VJ823_07100, partial [Rhodanobacteraceae bacterium]|nr:hypothetical protein [Rhodanobacteraceae bacterium]
KIADRSGSRSRRTQVRLNSSLTVGMSEAPSWKRAARAASSSNSGNSVDDYSAERTEQTFVVIPAKAGTQ